ncbi:hypothetical protein TNCV_3746611 [Trichonephila clavipes]|nr:hypothetical protein TNCV_3746611 [Trichonephila clavipes]
MYIQDKFGSYRSIESTKTDWNCTRYSIITCFAQTSVSLARLTQTLTRMPDDMEKKVYSGEKLKFSPTAESEGISDMMPKTFNKKLLNALSDDDDEVPFVDNEDGDPNWEEF